jgi:hypothetical protein
MSVTANYWRGPHLSQMIPPRQRQTFGHLTYYIQQTVTPCHLNPSPNSQGNPKPRKGWIEFF